MGDPARQLREARGGLVERGEWNMVRGYIGLPRSGKSTLMMAEALELVNRCYILAHDPNENLPTRLPDGRRVPIVRHDSLASVRKTIATNPAGIHAVYSEEDDFEDALILFARELAKKGLKRHGEKEYGVPVLIICDEILTWESANENRIGRVLRDLLGRRRPHHVGLWYGSQFPRQVHYQLMAMATDLRLFRIDEEDDLNRLRKGQVPEAVRDQLPRLKPYQSIHYVK